MDNDLTKQEIEILEMFKGMDSTRTKKTMRLVLAAIAYAELSERHMAKEEWRTRTLQEAANLARAGDTARARQKEMEVQLTTTQVYDYTDVSKELIAAVKPWRKK